MSTPPKATPAKKVGVPAKKAAPAKKAVLTKKAAPAKKAFSEVKKPRRGSTTLEMLESMQGAIQKALR